MRSFDIPALLYKEFVSECGTGLKVSVPGFPNVHIVWGENYPNTYLYVFLNGVRDQTDGLDPDFRISSSGAGSPWIRTSFELMRVSPFREMISRCQELYEQSEDYTRFARFTRA